MSKQVNKIIEVQEIIFKELKRLDEEDFLENDNLKKELDRSTAIYNQTTGFIKSINTNIKVMELAKRENTKMTEMTKILGLESDLGYDD